MGNKILMTRHFISGGRPHGKLKHKLNVWKCPQHVPRVCGVWGHEQAGVYCIPQGNFSEVSSEPSPWPSGPVGVSDPESPELGQDYGDGVPVSAKQWLELSTR